MMYCYDACNIFGHCVKWPMMTAQARNRTRDPRPGASSGAGADAADAGNSGLRQVEVLVLPDGTLRRPAAAAFLGLRPATLSRWAARGVGPPFFRLSKFCYYRLCDLESYKRKFAVERRPRQDDLL